MSFTTKMKTAAQIFHTQGIKGVFKIVRSKFDRSYHPDEAQIVFSLFEDKPQPGLMVDVGAHYGSSLEAFAENNWQVVAFEPDSHNRMVLVNRFGDFQNVAIDSRACSDQSLPQATLFSSLESSGVSGLSAFLDSHQASETITVTTLGVALSEYSLSTQRIDFLKIDTEGFDLMVLKGFPWEASPHPTVILCEFEDKKTEPLGYGFHDLTGFLAGMGYRLIISEWYPIKAYGELHRWRSFTAYPTQLKDMMGWGNIFAVKDEQLFQRLLKMLNMQ